jgi:hypothetical protein
MQRAKLWQDVWAEITPKVIQALWVGGPCHSRARRGRCEERRGEVNWIELRSASAAGD